MKKYRPMLRLVEALQYTEENKQELLNWADLVEIGNTLWLEEEGRETISRVSIGNWIVKENKFEIQTDEDFKILYEEVEMTTLTEVAKTYMSGCFCGCHNGTASHVAPCSCQKSKFEQTYDLAYQLEMTQIELHRREAVLQKIRDILGE